jgi:hypothetical protein
MAYRAASKLFKVFMCGRKRVPNTRHHVFMRSQFACSLPLSKMSAGVAAWANVAEVSLRTGPFTNQLAIRCPAADSREVQSLWLPDLRRPCPAI